MDSLGEQNRLQFFISNSQLGDLVLTVISLRQPLLTQKYTPPRCILSVAAASSTSLKTSYSVWNGDVWNVGMEPSFCEAKLQLIYFVCT